MNLPKFGLGLVFVHRAEFEFGVELSSQYEGDARFLQRGLKS